MANHNKQSLYTKYRPKNFDQVVGQKIAKEILINSITKNKINHAYLFYGIRGTGKTTLARVFAKSINCENKTDHNPCNKCSICDSINKESSFDVIEIDAASNNGVDEIRTIKENTTFLTRISKYKVYIIDEVHMLSKAAFNALLKTLEEPPKNTIFLLATTELHKIPQTVLSRTIVINLEVMSNEDIKIGLKNILNSENITYEESALDYIVMTSGGSLRDAISSLETTLLYNNKLSNENVIKALNLIDKDKLKLLILNKTSSIGDVIDNSNSDSKKISLLILEILMELINEGKMKFLPVLNSLIDSINNIKDPLLLKIALKAAFYNIGGVSHETKLKKEVIVEKIINEYKQKSQLTDEGSKEELKGKDVDINENIEKITKPIIEDKKVENFEENKSINENFIDKNKLNIITDYIDVNTYIYIVKNNDFDELEKINSRWKYKDTYITDHKFSNIVRILNKTKPLATTNKSLILGFYDEQSINDFKKYSLTKELFDFINNLLGSRKFILPINEGSWSKIISVKDTIDLNDSHKDIDKDFSDFIKTDDEELVEKASEIFGEDNIKYE